MVHIWWNNIFVYVELSVDSFHLFQDSWRTDLMVDQSTAPVYRLTTSGWDGIGSPEQSNKSVKALGPIINMLILFATNS